MKRFVVVLLLFVMGVLVPLGCTTSVFNQKTIASSPSALKACPSITIADTVEAQNGIEFPSDAAIFNVRDFGAKGDGVTDDSAALQAALNKAQNSTSILYIPNGTYLVSQPLYFYRWIMIQGQSTKSTVIKLRDNASGYSDPKKPGWVLFASPKGSKLEGNGDNTAHSQYVMNLTVETGTGNPGAIGIMFISHNGGGLRDVTIRSGDGQGLIGLDLRKPWDGPALYKNVKIEGFDVGIHARHPSYSSDFEDLTLTGQRIAGILNENHPLTIRKLVSSLDVPVLKNKGDAGLVVFLDSAISAKGNRDTAIQNDSGGAVFLRNVCIQGYAVDITGPRYTYTTAASKVISSHSLNSIFSEDRARFRDMHIADTPQLPWEPFSSWVSVSNYKHLVVNGDWAPAIQAAIDSGKTTVYFPHGNYYRAGSTIRIRSNVRVLQGLSSTILVSHEKLGDTPLFRIEPGKQSTVFIDRLIMGSESGSESIVTIEHASPSNLVVTNSRGMNYRNANTMLGDLFVDDMVGGPWTFAYPQKAWFRQLNVENKSTKIYNHKGDIWIQGLKSEGINTLVDNTSADAKTVVLGGLDYPANDSADRKVFPSFWNRGGSLTVVIANYFTNLELVREDVNGTG
jgi:Pectate lyase superfamily protein